MKEKYKCTSVILQNQKKKKGTDIARVKDILNSC